MSMLLRQAPEVTAVFAFSDDMAAGAAARLWEEGKRIPDDISLLGFDDNECARQLRPALTTIRQPHEQIAHLSITYLLEHTRFQEETSLTLPHELIQRQSCRLCKRNALPRKPGRPSADRCAKERRRFRACLKNVNTPKQRAFFCHTSLNSLLGISPIIKQALMEVLDGLNIGGGI